MKRIWNLKRSGSHYYFKDEYGNRSEKYCWASYYFEGFAIVRKEAHGPYYFRDIYGNLSEGFYDAWEYNNGFAVIKKEEHGFYQFRDLAGNLSESFYMIGEYNDDGLAIVQKHAGEKYKYRDTYGNLYDSAKEAKDALKKIQENKTQKETEQQPTHTQVKNNEYAGIEDYFKNRVSAYDLSPKDIYNNLKRIVAWEKYNCKLEIENADEEMRDEIFEKYLRTAEYIKHAAYECDKKQREIEQYTNRLF